MEKPTLIGLAISTLVLFFAMVKAEALKNIVSKVFSVKGQAETALSLSFLAIAVVVPAYFGWSLSEKEQAQPEPQLIVEQQTPKRTTKEGEIIDASVEAGMKLATLGVEAAEQVAAAKEKKIAQYETTRGERWVYAIGDWVSKSNDESLEDIYKGMQDKTNMYLFKEDRNLRFIRMEQHTKEELETGLEQFRETVSQPVEIIDLMSYCNYKTPRLARNGRQKIGRKKEKVFIDYYAAVK